MLFCGVRVRVSSYALDSQMFNKTLISFFFEDVKKFSIDKKKIISVINKIAIGEKKEINSLTYIFCSDKFLHTINVQALQHDTLTDVITFSYGDDKAIEGEIYISVDRVKDNAKIFQKEEYNELLRVIIHGILHLCGYGDKTEEEEKIMRAKEDFYLNLY